MDNSDVPMTIKFNENENQHCYETNGANVIVQTEAQSNNPHGSSKVKLKNIIGYKWENKTYPGHLIAIHKEGKIIAYSINVNGQGMVRLIHFGLGNKRALIKGMSKEVLDLQFADFSKEVFIASIEECALHVHRLDIGEGGESLTCTQMLKIENPLPDHSPKLDKVSWCPYVPEANDDLDEFSVMLLVWVRGNKFECYSCKTIMDTYGLGAHQAKNVQEGLVRSYEDERALITHATYSPDGTTLAISTADGLIRFYQIYFHETTPRCLHTWSPHDGAAISSFFFLDNLTQPIAGNSLWKYAITLAANNTEIKISKCDGWKTLQTIQFKSPFGQPLKFKAEIDRTSSYLVLSDQENHQMYVLQVLKENQLEQNGNNEENGHAGEVSRVFVKSIAEFHLVSSILSYGISNVSVRRYKCALSDNYLIDELEDYDEENNSSFCVVLRLFMILPESVQECHILYQPAPSEEIDAAPVKSDVQALMTPTQKQPQQLNLMTPEAFSSPIEKPKDVAPEVLTTIFMLAQTSQASPASMNPANNIHEGVKNLTTCALIEDEKVFNQKLPVTGSTAQLQGKSAAASGGSSPSREVRDIMLKADSVNEDYYPGEESDDDEEIQNKDVLNALNSLDVDFKNIDDDEDDDEDDGNEEDDEDDEPTAESAQEKTQGSWPQAPQFIEAHSGPATSKQVETLSNRMNQMIEIMENQSRYIAELRHEIFLMKSRNVADAIVTHKNLEVVEANVKKMIDQNSTKMENSAMIRDKKQRELVESTMQMYQQLSRNQINSMETVLKDNIFKICSHKAFVESVGNSILAGIHKPLEQAFKNAFREVIIPSYEKITHEMFQEMAQSFTSGTKEYTRAFDNYMKQYGAVQFQMNEFSGAIRQIPEKIDQATRSSVVPVIHNQNLELRQCMDRLSMKITQDVKELVKNEIQKGFERQVVNLEESVLSVVQRSHAETPAPTIFDQQEHIKQLLSHGEINKAFHQALISSDLSLLEFTIEKADITKVFEPCPLDQSVLLSLIQQLTADMSKFSETKVRYLSNGVISLNMNDPITKEHAPKILRELYNTIQTFLNSNPSSSFGTSLRMVIFACQSHVTVSQSL